jgi:hypothetical protein
LLRQCYRSLNADNGGESGVNINLSYDASAAHAPAGFKIALAAAVGYLDGLIANPITVNINVGYGEYNGETLTGGVSEGGPEGVGLSYAQLVAELTANATSPADRSALAHLPASDPTNGGMFLVSYAEQKAWGMVPATSGENDGSVGFGIGGGIPYDYSTNGTVTPGTLDFLGIAEHELTHALGRIAGLQFAPGWYAPLDLFRYFEPGHLELASGEPAYFSIDGGATDLARFSTVDDPGDWASTALGDAFDAISDAGVANVVTAADRTEMDVLGFTLACFAAGTRVATAHGATPVEDLRIGQRVLTVGGAPAPVVWLGRRRVVCRCHPRPRDVLPVLVRAGAFAPGQPQRDLRLSPDHAVFYRDALIPVRYLVNGASIAQVACDAVEYWHVELPRHALLLAEGLPAESFLDTGNRAAFVRGVTAPARPEASLRIWRRHGCARLLLGGPDLAAAHRCLLRRARQMGFAITGDPALAVLAGERHLPVERDGARLRVRLPPGSSRIRLCSRTFSPAHEHPRHGDPRALGVAVGRLWRDGREASLDSTALGRGWHAREPDWRWTDGDAALDVSGAREIAFAVAMTGRYWVAPATA